jgi:hypothetical protein
VASALLIGVRRVEGSGVHRELAVEGV